MSQTSELANVLKGKRIGFFVPNNNKQAEDWKGAQQKLSEVTGEEVKPLEQLEDGLLDVERGSLDAVIAVETDVSVYAASKSEQQNGAMLTDEMSLNGQEVGFAAKDRGLVVALKNQLPRSLAPVIAASQHRPSIMQQRIAAAQGSHPSR